MSAPTLSERLERALAVVKANPLLSSSALLFTAYALAKYATFLILKARVPAAEEAILHSYPEPARPPLRSSRSALSLLEPLRSAAEAGGAAAGSRGGGSSSGGDGSEAAASQLWGEVVASHSRLCLAGLVGASEGGGDAPSSPGGESVGLPMDDAASPQRSSSSSSSSSSSGTPASSAPPTREDLLLFLEQAQIQRLGETLRTHHKVHLHSLMAPRALRRGEVLMAAGADAQDGLYLVTSGRFGVMAGAAEPLCVFEAGTSLGENALIAGVIPGVARGGGAPAAARAASRAAAGAPQWMPSVMATRPSTVVALEDSSVLCLNAAHFSDFCALYPEAGATIVLESTCRQWRVAHTLLVEYFLLEEAWQASLEPPGESPAFAFAAGEGGLWGVAAARGGGGRAAGGSSSSAATAAAPLPPPIAIPLKDLEAAADSVQVYAPGAVVYAEGAFCDALYCVLEGWAATSHAASGFYSSSGSSGGRGLAHAPGFPLASLRKAAAHAGEGGGDSGGGGSGGSSGAAGGAPRPSLYLRLLGRGCLSAGPACLNSLTHRETLTAVGDVPLRVAVFRRATFTALAKTETSWGGQAGAADPPSSAAAAAAVGGAASSAGLGFGGGSHAASTADLSTPNSTPRPSPAAPPHAFTLPRSAIQLFVALAVARSMVGLPRMLLSLGMRRMWRACGEAIFCEGEASNGMYFIVSGRVRCETKPVSRPANLPHFAPRRAEAQTAAQQQQQQKPYALHVDFSAGGTVGELSVLSKEVRRSSTAVAARDCELVHISGPSFSKLAARHASVYEHFTASLARRVSDTMQALMQGRGGWGASSGAPSFLGVEKAVGIPFSLPAPPPPVLSFGGFTHSVGRRGGERQGGGRALPSGALVRTTSPTHASAPAALLDGASAGASPQACARFSAPAPPRSTHEAWLQSAASLVPLHPCAPSFSTLTLVPCGSDGLPRGAILNLARQLAQALAATEGGDVTLARRLDLERHLGEGAASSLNLQYGRSRASAWLGGLEERSAFTVLVVEDDGATDSLWARLCVQHSDVVLLVGAGGASPQLGRLEEKLQLGQTLARVDLCLLQPAGTHPTATRAWFDSSAAAAVSGGATPASGGGSGGPGGAAALPPTPRPWRRNVTQHHHIRVEPSGCSELSAQGLGDVARLSRFLTGRAIGVVLGGGGSRGLAHLGLIRELVQRGVPIDVIGGASQGSFMAAAWAATEDLAGMEAKVNVLAQGVGSTFNILTALTLPLVSWTSGAHFDDLIRTSLGNTQIEDMPGPRFFCVSLNATDGALAVHAVGPLWRYVRASMGVIKLLPPVFDKETKRLLLDGGYVANLPVDVLHALLPGSVGLTFACDVENKDSTANWLDISDADYGRGDSVELSGWWVAWRSLLAGLGLGAPMRVPWTDELYLQCAYIMHYSSLRALLSEEGYDGAMREAVDREDAGEAAADAAQQGGPGAAEGRGLGRPHLCYIRPKVGKYTLLQYDAIKEIVEVGGAASKAQLDKWERRWQPLN